MVDKSLTYTIASEKTSINISAGVPDLIHLSSDKTYECVDEIHTRQKLFAHFCEKL